MASLEAIRAGILDIVRQQWPETEVYDVMPQTIRGIPAVVIMPDDDKMSRFQGGFGMGIFTWHLKVYVIVGGVEPDMDTKDLDSLIDPYHPNSVPQLLFHNAALLQTDGTDSNVEGLSGYGGLILDSGAVQTGACIHLTVHTVGP